MSLLDMPLPGRVAGRIVGHGWNAGIDQYRGVICEARASGESVASLARRYGVTPQRIYQVLK